MDIAVINMVFVLCVILFKRKVGENMKIWLKRALRTFFQTAVGYLAVNVAVVDFSADKAALKSCLVGLGVSAVSAGISAVMNLKEN